MSFALFLTLLAGSASGQTLPGALVWLPPEGFKQWSGVDALMRNDRDLMLTIGVSPAMATPLVKAALAPWIEKGRLEVAARIDGDPILTMIAGHPAAPRPQDPLERVVHARERLEKALGSLPSGFVPGAGAVDAAVASSLGQSGAAWILAGPYAGPEEPWSQTGTAVLVPSGATALYDESASTSSVFLAAAASIARPSQGWATVGALARARADLHGEPSPDAAWPAWDSEAAASPPAGEGARAAWEAYGAAAETLQRYQNSGSADLRTLDAAIDLLRRCQAARYYRAADDENVPAGLRTALVAVYKRLKLPAPHALYGSGPSISAATAAAGPSDGPTGVRALSGPSWFEFRAPPGTIALLPTLTPGATAAIADGGTAADPWRILSLRGDWDDAEVRLTVRVGRASHAAPRPVYELYTDFNRVLGAGRVPLLEGRAAVVLARDAWELALSIAGDEARLFRARGGGEPDEIAVFKAHWKSDRGEVVVSVPRSFMRGNPARWGWAAVALAEDPARPGRSPAASLVGADGTILLGVLAPAGQQKPILSRANARVPAARLDP
ncbi:MAG: hypothetical protein Q8T11_03615 [Elusimicrobiota bacterium]|nr:hypothetical protein [Elusimicrobiota bacterium]